jgi:hypothetical protein
MHLELKDWIDVTSASAAVLALLVSLASFRTSSKALRLSEKQDQRKEPQLIAELLTSYFERLPNGGKLYAFSLSVRNPSDSNNAIAMVEMHVRYSLKGANSILVKLPSMSNASSSDDPQPRLAGPTSIPAHEAIQGWCSFLVAPQLLNGNPIESYHIAITDTHGLDTNVEVLVVNEKKHAT